jgi:clumping factor A
MTQKTTNKSLDANAKANAETAEVIDSNAATTAAADNHSDSSAAAANGAGKTAGKPGELSPALIELVMELRDTVKRLDPRRHTAKTLKRALSNVTDILDDIDTLYQQAE